MTRLTDTCEKEVRELIASLNGLPGFQHEKELMGEVDYLRDSFSEVFNYLHWNADNLCGDDLIGDGRLTKRYEEILSKVDKALNGGRK